MDRTPLEIVTEMVEEFQCPGCTNGHKPDSCCSFELDDWDEDETCRCKNHSAGTFMAGVSCLNLGLPKGFNRVQKPRHQEKWTNIRLMPTGKIPKYNHLNIPVWAMEKDGYLFVRVICPRVDWRFVDVIKGGKFTDLPPNTINVAEFIDEID